jgi:hypothetical protein
MDIFSGQHLDHCTFGFFGDGAANDELGISFLKFV